MVLRPALAESRTPVAAHHGVSARGVRMLGALIRVLEALMRVLEALNRVSGAPRSKAVCLCARRGAGFVYCLITQYGAGFVYCLNTQYGAGFVYCLNTQYSAGFVYCLNTQYGAGFVYCLNTRLIYLRGPPRRAPPCRAGAACRCCLRRPPSLAERSSLDFGFANSQL